jgi:uncharacterized membrane protein
MENDLTWWQEHAAALEKKQLITRETSNSIGTYFKSLGGKTAVEIILICCAILATLSVSGGIISIVAHNWDSLSKGVRVFLSIMPVVTGLAVFSYSILRHSYSRVWMECSAVFLILMAGSSIALVKMVYQTGGAPEDLLLTWMVIAIPIIYIANSTLSAVMYAYGITTWAWWKFFNTFSYWGYSTKDTSLLYFWLLLAAIIPHFIMHVKPGVRSLRSTTLGWTLGMALLYGCMVAFLQHQAVSMSLAMVMLYAIGKHYYKGPWFWQRPFQTIALGNIFVLLTMYTYDSYLHTVMEYNHYMQHPRFGGLDDAVNTTGYSGIVILFNCLIPVIFIGTAIYYFAKNKNNNTPINWVVALYPIILIVGLYLVYNLKENYDKVTWIFNGYLFFAGGYYMYKGWRQGSNIVVAIGVLVLSNTLLLRYFDNNLRFYTKGIIYIAIGIAFLIFNYYFSKSKGFLGEQPKQTDNDSLDAI